MFVYILTNWNDKVMYVGVTNNRERRVIDAALTREKEIKKWRRETKNALVTRMNPDWKDLM